MEKKEPHKYQLHDFDFPKKLIQEQEQDTWLESFAHYHLEKWGNWKF